MKSFKFALPLLAASFALAGCPGDDTSTSNSDTTGDESTSTAGTDPTTMNTTMNTTMTSADSTMGMETTTVDPTGATTTGDDPFVYNDTPFEDYTQVDRMGFAAVNSGLIIEDIEGLKDDYNLGNPADDSALTFAGNVLNGLTILHLGAVDMADQVPDNTGLDDDLLSLGLTPCVPPGLPMDNCDDQGAPFVLPDTISINLGENAGFPNGRRLADPAVDIVFGVILLDLADHPVDFFTDLDGDGTPGPSLNPLTNDVPFEADFPYLAPAQ